MYKKKKSIHTYIYIYINILYIHDRLRRESLNEIGRASGPQAIKREINRQKKKKNKTEKKKRTIDTLASYARVRSSC